MGGGGGGAQLESGQGQLPVGMGPYIVNAREARRCRHQRRIQEFSKVGGPYYCKIFGTPSGNIDSTFKTSKLLPKSGASAPT